jgi:3D (Asp-Asp-Asp) domain-containing protein
MKTSTFNISLIITICIFIFMICGLAAFRHVPQPADTYINVFLQKPYTELRGTVYPPKTTQTKQYVILASGIKVRNDDNILQKHYCSLSRDLGRHFNFGDTISVTSSHPLLSGRWIVHDWMADGSTNAIDFFISRNDLKQFKHGVYNVTVEPWNK